jgi:hypothetical protein
MARKILFLKYGLPGTLALLFFSGMVYYLFFQPQPYAITTLETIVQTKEGNRQANPSGTVVLSLFYPVPFLPGESPLLLKEEKRPVRLFPQAERLALEALKELSKPSPSGSPPVLPPDALPLHVFFTDTQLAIVDYNRRIQEGLPGGMQAELAAMNAILHTITFNFPRITAVRLLIEGKEQETLAGHFGISGNLQADLSQIQGYQNPSGNIHVEPLPP